MRQIRFKVLDKTWTIRLMTSKGYAKKHSDDSLGITTMYKRRIDLSPFGLTYEVVCHELIHAYLHEMCFTSTNEVTRDDLEEVFAELFSKRGEEIIALAKLILTQIEAIKADK